jgi:hypothetical protein
MDVVSNDKVLFMKLIVIQLIAILGFWITTGIESLSVIIKSLYCQTPIFSEYPYQNDRHCNKRNWLIMSNAYQIFW